MVWDWVGDAWLGRRGVCVKTGSRSAGAPRGVLLRGGRWVSGRAGRTLFMEVAGRLEVGRVAETAHR